jgi:PUA domain protein
MSLKIKNRHRLKNKDIRNILNQLQKNFICEFFNEKSSVETGEYEENKIIIVDGQPLFMYQDDNVFFTLHGLNYYKPKNRFVVVDMGAVKFVTNGADVMAPGIIDADKNIIEDDQVWICDERNKTPLAIGIATMNGEQMIAEEKGKAIKVVHWVGDKVWNLPAKSL